MRIHPITLVCAVTTLLVLPFAAQAQTKGGDLEGTLTVTAPSRPDVKPAQPANDSFSNDDYGNNDDGYGDSYGDKAKSVSAAGHKLPEEVVIFLKEVPGDYAAPLKHVSLDQKYIQFTHHVLAVLKGTTIDFTNHDPIYHNIFTNSQLNKFDLGRKESGEVVSVKMNKVEVPVKVYCEIHSSMKSNILVLQNPFFTTVEPGQNFELTGIPPGTYTLIAWHDYWQPVQQTVTIKKGKKTQVHLTLDKVRS